MVAAIADVLRLSWKLCWKGADGYEPQSKFATPFVYGAAVGDRCAITFGWVQKQQ